MTENARLRKALIRLIPFYLIVAFALGVILLFAFKPEPRRRSAPPPAPINVQVSEIVPQPYQVWVESYGLVQPLTQSRITAQVAGKIDFVADEFRAGGYFEKGQRLVGIEKADYQVEMDVAYANLLEAKQLFLEESARAEQARQDWQRLNRNGSPPPLVAREPQLAAAKARLASAEANHNRAKLNLSRTDINAPYDGRVLSKNVDIGQSVAPNFELGEIFATDVIEVQLPIKNSELQLLDLPHRPTEKTSLQGPSVTITSNLGKQTKWQGQLVRTSGAIDSVSRQLYVVARIENPFRIPSASPSDNQVPLKIGQYVTARIKGDLLNDAITIPNKAIYQGTYVFVYENGGAYRRDVDIAWQNNTHSLIEDGLAADDQLILTSLGQVVSGTPVKASNGEGDLIEKDRPVADRNAPGDGNWRDNIPPERLKRLEARAEKEGKSVEQLVKEIRAQRRGEQP